MNKLPMQEIEKLLFAPELYDELAPSEFGGVEHNEPRVALFEAVRTYYAVTNELPTEVGTWVTEHYDAVKGIAAQALWDKLRANPPSRADIQWATHQRRQQKRTNEVGIMLTESMEMLERGYTPNGEQNMKGPEDTLAFIAARIGELLRNTQADSQPEILRVSELIASAGDDGWRIDGLWPKDGRVMLAAKQKAGKTTLVGNVVRSLVSGEPFLGRFEVAPVGGNILIIDNELPMAKLGHWLADHGLDSNNKVRVLSLRGRVATFDIMKLPVRAAWAQRLNAENVDVLIFDCLRPALDALGLSENNDATKFTQALDALAAEAGIAELLLVHHAGHDAERARGDSGLLGTYDANWFLKSVGTTQTELSAKGRDVQLDATLVNYDATDRSMTADGYSRAEGIQRTREDKVMDYVRRHPGCSTRQIAGNAGVRSQEAQKIVKDLAARNRIRRQPGTGNSVLHYVVDHSVSVSVSNNSDGYIDTLLHEDSETVSAFPGYEADTDTVPPEHTAATSADVREDNAA